MHYNLMTEPWIEVIDLQGNRKLMGIKQCLKEAHLLKDIAVPVLYAQRAYIYQYLTIELLSTIVMAAYYKPETRFAATRAKYLAELARSLDTPEINAYIQKYADRFDLCDKERPFLQDITLSDSLQQNYAAAVKVKDKRRQYDYIALINPLAPGKNNKVAGSIRNTYVDFGEGMYSYLAPYVMSGREFAYAVLYHNSFCHSPCGAQYKAGLRANSSLYGSMYGKTLAETIAANCITLERSQRPNEDDEDVCFDAPVWEWDSIADYVKYSSDNVLAGMYYPIKTILGRFNDEGNVDYAVLELAKTERIDKDVCAALIESSMTAHPYAVRQLSKKDAKKNSPLVMTYLTYRPTDDAHAMAIAVTKDLGNMMACPIITRHAETGCKIRWYYRYLDKYKANMLAQGRIILPDSALILLDAQKRQYAVDFQEACNKATYLFQCALQMVRDNAFQGEFKKQEEFSTELARFTFQIAKYFFDTFIPALDVNTESAMENAKKWLLHEAAHQVDDNVPYGTGPLIRNAAKNRMYAILYKTLHPEQKKEETTDESL